MRALRAIIYVHSPRSYETSVGTRRELDDKYDLAGEIVRTNASEVSVYPPLYNFTGAVNLRIQSRAGVHFLSFPTDHALPCLKDSASEIIGSEITVLMIQIRYAANGVTPFMTPPTVERSIFRNVLALPLAQGLYRTFLRDT